MNKDIYVQVKPVGSFCNLKCDYCYVEKFKINKMFVMSNDILERIIFDCIESSCTPTITWHGGEPTLAGISFFEKAAEYVEKYKGNKIVRNVIQTNATTITPHLSKFFSEHNYEVGISIDGPLMIHGKHRKTLNGKNTYKAVIKGLDLLRNFSNYPFVITTVTNDTLPYAIEVFDFLVNLGFKVIKYSPVFDAKDDCFSISSENWFLYLKKIFNRWVDLENSEISIREIDEIIAWLENKSINFCSSTKTCLNWVSVDPKGEIYPCEYLRSKYSYGNIIHQKLKDISNTEKYCHFCKLFNRIPVKCKKCNFFDKCGNGCPATRILPNGKMNTQGIYVYCEQRKKLFQLVKDTFNVNV